jgi:integrase
VSVKGKRIDAQRELTRLLSAVDSGMIVESDKLTVACHLRAWLDNAAVAPKTLERYRALAEQQIIPHLGAIVLQRLRPATVKDWHATLLKSGGKNGAPLAPRTVGHAHRLLHTALQAAVVTEKASRNVAGAISPPKAELAEIQILKADEIPKVLSRLTGHELYAIANTALATGARRGELLAVSWACLDLDTATMRIDRALEQTKAGLRFKPPKTKYGRRTITLPAGAVTVMREHRLRQLELRMQLGLGKPDPDALVFSRPTGEPIPPNDLSRDWRRACKALMLPRVMFHALRHTHASALIAAGIDIVKISRRLGHGSPAITLKVYSHLFDTRDDGAAEAIGIAMGAHNGS